MLQDLLDLLVKTFFKISLLIEILAKKVKQCQDFAKIDFWDFDRFLCIFRQRVNQKPRNFVLFYFILSSSEFNIYSICPFDGLSLYRNSWKVQKTSIHLFSIRPFPTSNFLSFFQMFSMYEHSTMVWRINLGCSFLQNFVPLTNAKWKLVKNKKMGKKFVSI